MPTTGTSEGVSDSVAVSASATYGRRPRRRLLLVASVGGHWIELNRLVGAFADFDCHFVSTVDGLVAPTDGGAVTVIQNCSRHAPLATLKSLFQLYAAIRRFDPDVIMSTGAAPGALAMIVGKVRGSRTVWIESLANCDNISLSGRGVRFFTDVRLTQWEHMAASHGGLRYIGRIL